MVGGTVCAEATKDPTHADHDAAASSALTSRDALFANLGVGRHNLRQYQGIKGPADAYA